MIILMNKTFLPLVLSFFVVFATACQNQPQETATATEADTVPAVNTSFEASPQRVEETDVTTLNIGEKAPDFNLPGADGKNYQLSDFADASVLAIIFTCNHCPTAQAYEERIKELVTDYQDQGVAVVAISPNSPLAILYNELSYTDLGDTYEDMQKAADDRDFNFPYLYDGDDHAVSVQYGPVATPHAFVFGPDRTLQYVGRLDASEKPGTGQAEDVRAAIDAVLAGESECRPRRPRPSGAR